MKTVFILTIALFGFSPLASASERKFEMATVEVNGVKFWLPSSITVKKGDKVQINAVSKVPGENSVHGLSIDEYKVQEIVTTKGSTITFTAQKPGIFQIRCHMHPPHIGSQLIVLE